MKKFLIKIFLIFACFVFPFGGCFGNGGKDVEVLVVHATKSEVLSFNTDAYASQLKVQPEYKEGKILLGYYDTKTDEGKMYFDFLGKCTTNGWDEEYPDTLYAVYAQAEDTFLYTPQIKYDETPYNPSYKWSGGFTEFYFADFSEASIQALKGDDEYTVGYANAARQIYSNPNTQVTVTMSFSCKQICECCALKLKYKVKIGDESFEEKQVSLSNEWQTFSFSTRVFAKQLKGNGVEKGYISLLTNPASQPHLSELYSVKNISYTIGNAE